MFNENHQNYMAKNNGLLSFSLGNAKLGKRTAHFSVPSGHTCPGAKDCLSKADRESGRIQDGKDIKFRCFSASQEAAFKNTRLQRWHNFELLRGAKTKLNMRDLIIASLPSLKRWDTMRIHVGGDFFNQAYFTAWVEVAERHPEKIFYAYSKSGPQIKGALDKGLELPENFHLTGSSGGKYDDVWADLRVKKAFVVLHPDDTELPIDKTDRMAFEQDEDFALLIHGTQPQDHPARAAMNRLDEEEISYSYGRAKTPVTA